MVIAACQSTYTKILDHLPRLFGNQYLITKFREDFICRFQNIPTLIFRRFGLKMLIPAPKKWGLGDLTLN